MVTGMNAKLRLFCAVMAMAAMPSAWSADPVFTNRTTLIALDSGWGADTYSVKLLQDSSSGVFTNPAGCRFPQAGYVTDPKDPGRGLYAAQLLEAFFRNYPVRLLISGTDCPFNKPRIISVSLCRPSPVGQC